MAGNKKADDTVPVKPVCAANSLLVGILQGISPIPASVCRFDLIFDQQNQWLPAKLPTQRSREILEAEQGNFDKGNFSRARPAASNFKPAPMTTAVARKTGSSLSQSFRSRRSPIGKNPPGTTGFKGLALPDRTPAAPSAAGRLPWLLCLVWRGR